MNVIVDSPLDAFAFNTVNLTPLLTSIINNLWACVALIMAGSAFSFWRLRSIATKPSQNVVVVATPPPRTTLQKQNDDVKTDYKGDQEEEERCLMMTRSNSKKLFTVYYEEREIGASVDNDDDEEELMDGEDEVVGDCVMIKRWESSKELTVEMDLGWYSYQDRKVINGCVVKLWECSQSSSGEKKDGNFSPRCDYRNGTSFKRRCSSPVGVTQLVL